MQGHRAGQLQRYEAAKRIGKSGHGFVQGLDRVVHEDLQRGPAQPPGIEAANPGALARQGDFHQGGMARSVGGEAIGLRRAAIDGARRDLQKAMPVAEGQILSLIHI